MPSTRSSERGLLGLAFHPDYATNGFFYVYATSSSISGDTEIGATGLGRPERCVRQPRADDRRVRYPQRQP